MTRIFGFFVALAMVSLAPNFAHAFCVYNKTDVAQEVDQSTGGKSMRMFSKNIAPGDSNCCNWHDSSCNSNGKRDSQLTFVTSSSPSYIHNNVFCGTAPTLTRIQKAFGANPSKVWGMEAGGWANIVPATGSRPASGYSGTIYTVQAFNADGQSTGTFNCVQ